MTEAMKALAAAGGAAALIEVITAAAAAGESRSRADTALLHTCLKTISIIVPLPAFRAAFTAEEPVAAIRALAGSSEERTAAIAGGTLKVVLWKP